MSASVVESWAVACKEYEDANPDASEKIWARDIIPAGTIPPRTTSRKAAHKQKKKDAYEEASQQALILSVEKKELERKTIRDARAKLVETHGISTITRVYHDPYSDARWLLTLPIEGVGTEGLLVTTRTLRCGEWRTFEVEYLDKCVALGRYTVEDTYLSLEDALNHYQLLCEPEEDEYENLRDHTKRLHARLDAEGVPNPYSDLLEHLRTM